MRPYARISMVELGVDYPTTVLADLELVAMGCSPRGAINTQAYHDSLRVENEGTDLPTETPAQSGVPLADREVGEVYGLLPLH